ncbi:hypothetical protein MKX08_006116 [Trichoderma sp. CBMAI-0020]|nr:hypothetical protein MKX08_006116 [Trichoderma sp. CBMAI-0020]
MLLPDRPIAGSTLEPASTRVRTGPGLPTAAILLITPFDNGVVREQMMQAFKGLGGRGICFDELEAEDCAAGFLRRGCWRSHLDTWNPAGYLSSWGSTHFNYGSMFWMASQESLHSNATYSPFVHTGLRTCFSGGVTYFDHEDDDA